MIRIPYGRQTIDDSDIEAIRKVLLSDWLTQGPMGAEFEDALADYCGARHAVVFSNGTAALQAAYFAGDIKSGDEFVTSPLTFAATANAGLWQGARPIFADIDSATGNLDPQACEAALTPATRAIVPVDFAGLPAQLDALRELAQRRGLLLIEDACHALGASYKGRKVGSMSDMTIFSFHPVKSITTGEGGAVLTNDHALKERLAQFRSHGIHRGEDWDYAVEFLGQNFRLTDIQSALGLSQLKRLDDFIACRRELAGKYDQAFAGWPELEPPLGGADESSRHLYVLRLRPNWAYCRRDLFRALRQNGIGVQVHYIPVYWHPLFEKLGYRRGLCPRAETFYEGAISLPLFPTLSENQQDEVVRCVRMSLDQCCPH